MKEDINETRFENGLVVLTDRMKGVRSVTLGFFLRVGSRHEPVELNGITHFIEHAVFKGTRRRSALEIAVEQDRLGGTLDAFTTHEETGFAIKVIDDQLDAAFDLVADMLAGPRFDEREMQSERRVILEELKMTDDLPEERLAEIFSRAYFRGHPLGLNIAGTPKTVRTFGRDAAAKYHRRMFRPSNLVIAAAGNVDHSRFVKQCRRLFPADARAPRAAATREPSVAAPIVARQNPMLEQAHMLLAAPLVSGRDPRRYAADLLAHIIGGGTSSRLWQKVREERGLAYSVGASTIMFRDCGLFMVSAATSPEQVPEVVEIAAGEMGRIAANGVSADELELGKQQTRAAVLLSLEDSAARAASLAHSEMLHGRQITLEESLANVEAVPLEDIRALAREFFRTERMAFAALGDLRGIRIRRKDLAIQASN
jgi:predicted Zn-dependent peptidase